VTFDRQRYRPVVLVHAYLGALIFGGVLLAASLLVGKRGKLRVRSLAFWGFALSFFGMTAVALRLSGWLGEKATATIGVLVGVTIASVALYSSRRRRG
jgi:hypothetical protein